MGWLYALLSRISFVVRIVIEKKTSQIVIDPATFEECVSKDIRVWSWKRFKRVRYLVHFKGGRFVVTLLS